jgi:inhibitor of cysteine peptidase
MKKILVLAAVVCSCADMRTASSSEYENQLVIELDGNRTTGYSWTYTIEPEGVAQEVSMEYRISSETAAEAGAPAEASAPAGAGGVFVFVFEGAKPGSAELRFSYARPWESGVAPVKTAVYALTVNKSGKISAVLEPVN